MSSSRDEQLKLVTIAALTKLFGSEWGGGADRAPTKRTPLSSMELLTQVMTTKVAVGIVAGGKAPPRFRLTDLGKFEAIIEDLARTWTGGRISFSRDSEGGGAGRGTGLMTIWEVAVGAKALALPAGPSSISLDSSHFGSLGKRKRVVDEEADSAAGNEEDDDDIYKEDIGSSGANSQIMGTAGPAEFDPAAEPIGMSGVKTPSHLGSLSKELREVYAILQRGTAKGRLLAEQVRLLPSALVLVGLTLP